MLSSYLVFLSFKPGCYFSMLDIQESPHFDKSVYLDSPSLPLPAMLGKPQSPRLIPENQTLKVFVGETSIANFSIYWAGSSKHFMRLFSDVRVYN